MSELIDPKDLVELQKNGVEVIDVREPKEWAAGHVPGARHVPLDVVKADTSAAVPKDNVAFVCAKGPRSLTAAKLAEKAGRKHVWVLDGGTEAWIKAGYAIAIPAKQAARASESEMATTEGPPLATAIGGAGVIGKIDGGSRAVAEILEVPEPTLDALVGANLRELRQKRGLSLDDVARRAGVSRTVLGQIELGRNAPSIGVIWKIAQTLDVHFSTLLSSPQQAPENMMLASAKAKRLLSADGRFSSRALFPFGGQRTVEFYELWLAPHSIDEADAHQPGTRENLVVTSGKLELTVGEQKFFLGKGDAVVFAADVPHSYKNTGSDDCWMYLVMTYTTPVS